MKASVGKKLVIFLSGYLVILSIFIVIVAGRFLNRMRLAAESKQQTLHVTYNKMLRQQVQTAHSLLEAVHRRVQAGEITEDGGKKLAAGLIREIRYADGDSEYFWIDDLRGYNVVLHGNKAVEGFNRNDLQDARGTYIIRELRNLALRGGGYLDYFVPRDGETNPVRKRGYSKLFEPYGWVIGTSIFMDDVDAVFFDAVKDTLGAEHEIFLTGVVSFLIFAFVLSVIVFVLNLQIAKPITAIAAQAKKIGDGNFDVKIDSKWKQMGGEIELLSTAFQKLYGYVNQRKKEMSAMAGADFTVEVVAASEEDQLGSVVQVLQGNLSRLIAEVRNTVGQFNLGAEQLSKASQTLSQGANEQASSIEEITSALTETNAQVKHNAEKAQRARGLSKDMLTMAEKSQQGMQNLVEIMQRLNSSAIEINSIVKTIDDIAFQINLLALNANVEAARAGKYGKGFAVVADEVRNLAVKSANSVKETTAKVRDIVSTITKGHEVTTGVANQIESMYANTHQTIEVSEEVSASSQEQLLSMEQMSQGIHQINSVTQTTASSAEETASAAEELASQAIVLKQMVARFKIAQHMADSPPDGGYNGHQAEDRRTEKQVPSDEQKKRVIRLEDSDFGKF